MSPSAFIWKFPTSVRADGSSENLGRAGGQSVICKMSSDGTGFASNSAKIWREGGKCPPAPLFPTVLFLHHQSLPSNPSRELLNSSQMFALHFHKLEGKHLESLPTNVPSSEGERELFAKIDINTYYQFSFLHA